ncbi:phage tail tape measure protein [Azorhizobium caulinodans]|uniref:phage tail tape measure protein n=1 Tax=Azorhizobium caulinodans TaxID=7 RepID=UPI002FBEEBA1
MEPTDPVSLALTADTSAFTAGLAEAEASARNFSAGVTSAFSAAEVPARGFSSALGDAFASVAVKGRDLDTVLAGLGQRLSGMALNAALKPLEQGISNSIGQLFSGAFANGGVLEAGAVRAFADGGVVSGVRAFAEGGVVAAPTYFPMASGVGLMGEAGAEAILPLARGADGALGVRTQASGGGTTTVNVSVSTPDAGAFRRSDAYLSGLIARAVARGQRSL